MFNKQGKLIHNDEIQWILTVPAIWTDTAKQFMRTTLSALVLMKCLAVCDLMVVGLTTTYVIGAYHH
jgi:hypothetical protein